MHVLLAILSGLAAVFWALWRLDREGFDFAALNPFLWKRRAHWRQQYEADPLFLLSAPLEVASVLMLAIAREKGEISLEEIYQIKAMMVSKLGRTPQQADELFRASSHLLRQHDSIRGKVADILSPCRNAFTAMHVDTIDGLLTAIVAIAGPASREQAAIMDEFRSFFRPQSSEDAWS